MDSNYFKTPKPMASSTVLKPKRKRSSLNKHGSGALSKTGAVISSGTLGGLSLDGLSLNNDNAGRLEGHHLGGSIVKQSSALPAYYFDKNFGTPSITNGLTLESTVDESDLLKQFAPTDISTPRSSYASDIASSLSGLKHQLEHSNIALSKLCEEYSANLEFDNESFASGDLAAAKIARQEQSWLKERGAIGCASMRSDSIFAQLENCNMTDFFKKKSDLTDWFNQKSPEKDTTPVALVDVEDKRESVLSYTAFEKANTTAEIYELLRNGGNKENLLHENSVRSQPTSAIQVLSDSSNVCDKSLSSVRTVSSLDNLTGGKLPIETNRIELVWGCTQVGKRSLQNFVIRNKSLNKVHFKITSSNACFQIYRDQGESDAISVLTVMLYPAESRCFKVVFSPTSLGAFVERLRFVPISEELKSQQTNRQTLMLYGYGGHTHIDILNVAKDSNMKMWLSLGRFDYQADLVQKFFIRNMGSVSAFACISFISKALLRCCNVVIDPMKLVILPKSQEKVTISFTPTKTDLRHMCETTFEQVIEIGSVQIVLGAEPLRGRVRNVSKKLCKQSLEVPDQLVTTLCETFPNENMPVDIRKFTETVRSLKELIGNLVRKEIVLMIERDIDSTLLGQAAGIDETSFQSFAEGMVTIVPNSGEITSSCSVEPSTLVLTPPIKLSDQVLLMSHHKKPLHFQTSVSESDFVYVTPEEGILSPNDTVVINVACNVVKLQEYYQQSRSLQVSIYVDNEVFDVNVKIIFLKRT